jgi:hypothetical protein
MTMPPSERRQRRSEEHLTDAELNELVDGTMSSAETERAQVHLASCAECEERYRTLLATVAALKSAPSVMPRRSFQLTPEQAKLVPKQPSWLDRFSEWIVPGVPAIRAATLAIALLLLSVTAVDVITHRSNTSENAGPMVMRQAEPTQQAIPAQAIDSAPTSEVPILGAESDAAADQSGAASGGAAAATDTSGPMVSSAMQPPDSETDGATDTGESDIEAEAPPAPAAAMVPPQETSEPLLGASESMAEVAPAASPTAAGPETAATSPVAPATASPAPPSPAVAASPTPSENTGGNGGSGGSISRWRIAEFGLLLLLVWLGVTWLGRTRVGDSSSDGSDSDA